MHFVQDIVDRIIDELKDDEPSLHALALTSSSFRNRAQHHYFSSIVICDLRALSRLTEIAIHNAIIASNIRVLELHFGEACLSFEEPPILGLRLPVLVRLVLNRLDLNKLDQHHDGSKIGCLTWLTAPALTQLVLNQSSLYAEDVGRIVTQFSPHIQELTLQVTYFTSTPLDGPGFSSSPIILHDLHVLKLIYNTGWNSVWRAMRNFSPIIPLLGPVPKIDTLDIHTRNKKYSKSAMNSIQDIITHIASSLKHINVSGYIHKYMSSASLAALETFEYTEVWNCDSTWIDYPGDYTTKIIPLLDGIQFEGFKVFTWNIEVPTCLEEFQTFAWPKLFETMERLRKRAPAFKMTIVFRLKYRESCDGVQEFLQALIEAHSVSNVELRDMLIHDDKL